MQKVIIVNNLNKTYGHVKAIDDITFSVEEGEIFGMVGPNGAGKTTTIECLEGLDKPTSGSIVVLGKNPARERKQLQTMIGVQLQEAQFQDRIRVNEICDLFSSFYPKPQDYRLLLEKFGLNEKTRSFVSNLSGGQKQRLSIILALIPDPRIVFLDELTTGLDPRARRNMWNLIKELKNEGRTVFLTTHYMEEAENLCDRVLVIDNGKIVGLNSVAQLISSSPIKQKVTFMLNNADANKIKVISGVRDVRIFGNEVTVYGDNNDLAGIIERQLKDEIQNLRSSAPNLEDVYLDMTDNEGQTSK